MPCALHILNADRSLDAWAQRIELAFSASIALVSSRIPVGDVDVVVYNDHEYVVPELGVSGFCTSPRRLYLPLDVDHPNLSTTFERVFQSFLAHELHHCARRRIDGFAETLGQALVTEGLACCFEAELPGGSVPIYATRIAGRELVDLAVQAEAERELPLSGYGKWFFGEREPEIPNHAGYTLGYELVSKWLRRHGQTAASCYAIRASQVFAEA
jgi:uncharacterized protein YjaZ